MEGHLYDLLGHLKMGIASHDRAQNGNHVGVKSKAVGSKHSNTSSIAFDFGFYLIVLIMF